MQLGALQYCFQIARLRGVEVYPSGIDYNRRGRYQIDAEANGAHESVLYTYQGHAIGPGLLNEGWRDT